MQLNKFCLHIFCLKLLFNGMCLNMLAYVKYAINVCNYLATYSLMCA